MQRTEIVSMPVNGKRRQARPNIASSSNPNNRMQFYNYNILETVVDPCSRSVVLEEGARQHFDRGYAGSPEAAFRRTKKEVSHPEYGSEAGDRGKRCLAIPSPDMLKVHYERRHSPSQVKISDIGRYY